MSRLFGLFSAVAGGSATYYGYKIVGIDNIGGLVITAMGVVVTIAGILLFIGGKGRHYAEKITNI